MSAALSPPLPGPLGAPPGTTTIAAFILRAFLFPLLLLGAVAVAVAAGVEQSARSAAQVTAAQARLTLIQAAARDVSDLENGQRGFVITGNPAFLQPYRQGGVNLERHLRELEARVGTDPGRGDLARVRTLTQSWYAQAARPEIAARRISLESAAALVSGGVGKRTLEEVREVLAHMQAGENLRLRAALENSTAVLHRVRLFTVAGLLASGGLLVFAALRVARTLSRTTRQLTEEARHIAAGDYSARLPRTPLRELGELSLQFHRMAEAVQQREEALRGATRALTASNADLARSNRELEQFAYVASHDLQEPLRTIASYTELLARRYGGQLDERADQYIHFTISAAQRLKALIQDLLAYSRVRQAQHTSREVNTAELVGTLVQDLAAKIGNAGARVEIGDLPTLRASPELLHHVFLNLLTNAVKFRAPDRPPHVRVWAERGPGEWRFHIRDNGIGIEEQYFERIFGVFQRLHPMDEYPGSGIGLALARTAAERQGGTITVQSTPGEGSTFTLTLPDTPPPGAQEAPQS
ncbi:sensor histidine kinase [Deinococcus aerius]|uniref:histidine kinase n=1 Tax=Deinococcus aerius TaxID=200253 RepID=A0A2I9CW69_9DEIO|nr:CHASE3 domain-containing protein [Deinococcus aerius]GBF06234.1 sensor histidine kinase [Deinococcus aerius]